MSIVKEEKDVNSYILQETFCINLKWYRFSRGLSQEKLAELSNTTPKYISDLERGKFCPSFNKLQEIAVALGVHAYQLLKPDHFDEPVNSKRIDERR